MLLENTPVQEYQVDGHTVLVKREDMFGQYPAPALAKLRGARLYLQRAKENGWKRIGVYDTTISKAGQGIAYLCKEYDLECWLGFPLLKGTRPAESKMIAKEVLGATLFPLKAGRTAVCYYQFKHFIEDNRGFMLPLGLVCRDTVLEVGKVAREVTDKYKVKTIVLCTGTGTIACGVALGADAKVIGVSCGMSASKQWKRIRQLAFPENPSNLSIVPPKYGYYDKLDTSSCPFPTSPYYDMKAWEFLVEHIDELEEPVCFWNIGV